MLVLDQQLPDAGLAQAAVVSFHRFHSKGRGTGTYLVTGVVSGKPTSFFNTFAKVAFLLAPLKGVVAN